MDDEEFDYDVEFGEMSGSEIEDYLNDAPDPKEAVEYLWDYIEKQGMPYDWRWYHLKIKPYHLDREVLIAIIKSYSDWDSDFELDCINELASEVGIYDVLEHEPWKEEELSLGDIVYELGKLLDIPDLYF